jgi:hypothetical protein
MDPPPFRPGREPRGVGVSRPSADLYLSASEPEGPDWAWRWSAALAKERDLRFPPGSPHLSPRSLLVGGGRPEALGMDLPALVRRVLGAGAVKGLEEWTVEVDDPALPPEVIRNWAAGGVSRFSLRGEAARPEVVVRVLDLVRSLHPPRPLRVAAEVHLGDAEGRGGRVPGAGSAQGIEELMAAGVTSVALVEDDPRSSPGDPDARADDGGEWLQVVLALRRAGWTMSDLAFAHAPGVRPRYPRALARRRPILGLGPGAISFRHPHRRWNHPEVSSYLAAVEEGRDPVLGEEVLGPAEARLERIWAALRTDQGVRLPSRACPEQEPWFQRWRRAGWVPRNPGAGGAQGRLRLSPAGWLVADELAVQLAMVVERISPGGSTDGPERQNFKE